MDVQNYIRMLHLSNPLREPVLRSAIGALALPTGSRGLDAGCGIGLQALLLAEAVGPAGHVTGLDLSPEFLRCARGLVEEAGLSKRVTLQQGDVRDLPFADHSFDWAWSADCVGYAPLEPQPLIEELARVVRPGGVVAILAWSSEKLLPGYPLLEARLGATAAGIAPFAVGKSPSSHFMRGLGWLRAAGLEEVAARTFVGDAHAPMTEELYQALAALLEMRWPGAAAELSPEDRAAYRRLCRPASPDYILDHPDYYTFFSYSMFCGRVAR